MINLLLVNLFSTYIQKDLEKSEISVIIITLVVVVEGEIVSDRIKKTENNTIL
jgi:hypothetical protein